MIAETALKKSAVFCHTAFFREIIVSSDWKKLPLMVRGGGK